MCFKIQGIVCVWVGLKVCAGIKKQSGRQGRWRASGTTAMLILILAQAERATRERDTTFTFRFARSNEQMGMDLRGGLLLRTMLPCQANENAENENENRDS
jgi:hypothetical protein